MDAAAGGRRRQVNAKVVIHHLVDGPATI